MNDSKNFRIALLTGGSTEWREVITPLLLEQSDTLVVADTLDELLSTQSAARPEMFFVCHQPGVNDGITTAEQIRVHFLVTPLVLLAEENLDTLKTAVATGALAILEPPFPKDAFKTAFNRSSHLAQALRWEELKQQQNKNRAGLFMQSPCCQMFVDSDGMVTILNDEAANILGVDKYAACELSEISRRFFSQVGSDSPAELEAAIQSCTEWDGILSIRTANVSMKICSVRCTQIAESSGMFVTMHDITAEKSENEQLRISLQAARDCLLMSDISSSAREMSEFAETGSTTANVQEKFSLQTLLQSVVNDVAAGEAQATIKIPEYIPNNFSGDAKRLAYALKAVVSGSRRFAKATPQISISIKERTPEKMMLQISLRVENSAIKTDSYQVLADYLVSSTDMPGAAAGLGLAARLIGQMNGKMLIRTELGRSRTVSCTVPLLPLAAEEGESLHVAPTSINLVLDEPAPARQHSSLKVLVAEDNMLEQATMKHLLDAIGCQFIFVNNGREAVDEFETGEFDVVLMDILMPEMDGFEATRLIRERERITGGRIPVVALTSYSLKAIQEKCVSVGMNGYLAKPVAKAKLLEALQRLDKSEKLSQHSEPLKPALATLPVLDEKPVIENLDYDLETYRELVDMYLTGFSGIGDEIAEKLAAADLNDILESAHGLKGMASNIGGLMLAEVARNIQDTCREGKRPDSAVWVPVLKAQTAALKEALERLDWGKLERFATEAKV